MTLTHFSEVTFCNDFNQLVSSQFSSRSQGCNHRCSSSCLLWICYKAFKFKLVFKFYHGTVLKCSCETYFQFYFHFDILLWPISKQLNWTTSNIYCSKSNRQLGKFSIFCYKGKGVSVTYCATAVDNNRETKKTPCRNKHWKQS